MTGTRLIAGTDFHVQHQTQPRHHIAVISVRGTARLLRIETDRRAFLLAVEDLDRGIDIQNPRQLQRMFIAALKLGVQPRRAGRGWNRAQRPTERIVADHRRHS